MPLGSIIGAGSIDGQPAEVERSEGVTLSPTKVGSSQVIAQLETDPSCVRGTLQLSTRVNSSQA